MFLTIFLFGFAQNLGLGWTLTPRIFLLTRSLCPSDTPSTRLCRANSALDFGHFMFKNHQSNLYFSVTSTPDFGHIFCSKPMKLYALSLCALFVRKRKRKGEAKNVTFWSVAVVTLPQIRHVLTHLSDMIYCPNTVQFCRPGKRPSSSATAPGSLAFSSKSSKCPPRQNYGRAVSMATVLMATGRCATVHFFLFL